MLAMIAEHYPQYVGIFDSYSDEKLKTTIEDALSAIIEQNYVANAEKTVEAIKNTPSESELQYFVAQILANPALATKQAQMGYIAIAWTKSTTMSMETVMAHLMTLDDAAFAAALNSVAQADAKTMYDQYSDSIPALAAAKLEKVAAVFDAEYGNETDPVKLESYYDLYMPSKTSETTLPDLLKKLGVISLDTPSSINIYAVTFEDKDAIGAIISDYNASVIEAGREDDKIEYTDYIALLLSGVTKIVDAISYVLIAFVSISLVVSSIMIGIITYISVLERTKEIGVLRSIGASKRDVSLVFNAETIIVGLASGLFGIGFSLLLCIPINFIIQTLSGISTLAAFLEPLHAIILIAISVLLTMVAGLFPSRMAAKRDPVEALRTE